MLTINIFWVMVTLGLWIAVAGWLAWYHQIQWSGGFVEKSDDSKGVTRFWLIFFGLFAMATPFFLGLSELFWYVYGVVAVLVWLFVGGKKFYTTLIILRRVIIDDPS